MNHHYKNSKTLGMFLSHHWLGAIGVAAITTGIAGLLAPDSNSSIPREDVVSSKISTAFVSAPLYTDASDLDTKSKGAGSPKVIRLSLDTPNVEPAIQPPIPAVLEATAVQNITNANLDPFEKDAAPHPAVQLASIAPSLPQISRQSDISESIADKTLSAQVVTIASEQQQNTSSQATKPQSDQIKTLTIRKGDNMAIIFRRLGLSRADLNRVMNEKLVAKTFRNIYPGQKIEAHVSQEGDLTALRYATNDFEYLTVTIDEDGLHAEQIIDHPERRVAFAAGTINYSLFGAAAKSGLSNKQIMNLADIFAWDVDFGRDIRPGDRFAILYEALYRDTEQVGTGRILAAEFTNDGHTHRAVYFRHKDKSGYYDPKGHPMRKAFLRSPVNFTRISSRFNPKRWHPKLHKFRAHKGVDYAAPIGTAVKSAGNGKVKFAGRKGGYGRVVIIQHGQRYSTLYAHLHRIKSGIKPGKRVKQGQVIGTVGKSGLATGPHLHYEFRVDGAHRDPLKVKLPGAPALPRKLMTHFNSQTSGYLTQLTKFSSTNLATRD